MKKIVLCLSLVLFSAGCALKHPNGTPVSDYEKVVLANASLAQTNNSIARGVIQIQTVSPPILSVSATEKILRIQGAIAADDNRLTAILDEGPSAASGHAAEIQALISGITDQVASGIHDGSFAVKNPTSQQNFSADLQAINGLAAQITNTLRSAGVLK